MSVIDDKYNKGSALILVIVIMAVVSTISLLTLDIAMSSFQIKKSNSNIKRALYLAEDGLNLSSIKAYDLICEACSDSIIKAEEYLSLHPDDIIGAETLFNNNYKFYIINKAVNIISSNDNPYIEVTNYNNLYFVNNILTLKLKSRYVLDEGIEKSLTANLVVLAPEYIEVKTGDIELYELFYLNNYSLQ